MGFAAQRGLAMEGIPFDLTDQPSSASAAGPAGWCLSDQIWPEPDRTRELEAKEPLNKPTRGATVAFRDAWRDARCSRYREYRPAEQQCQAPGKPRPFRVCAKCGAGGVGLLGIVVQATTFVARLAIIRISRQTRSIGGLFRGSFNDHGCRSRG